MNGSFNWQLVQVFLAALDKRSLLGAARQLGSSQPTVGRQIAELEAQLGTVLFERTGRGLKPTDVALALEAQARHMADAAAGMQRHLSGASTELAGTVRITASQPVACYVLPSVLAAMRTALPAVQATLVVSNAVSNLLEREADIALRMVRPDQASLVAKRIAQVGMMACASTSYLATHGTPVVPADLMQHRLVGFDTHDVITSGFAAMGHTLTHGHFACRTDDLIAYWQAIRAGLGIGFVSTYMLHDAADVARVLPELPLPELPMWLAVHREVRTSTRIRAVYDFLADAVPRVLANATLPGTRP